MHTTNQKGYVQDNTPELDDWSFVNFHTVALTIH